MKSKEGYEKRIKWINDDIEKKRREARWCKRRWTYRTRRHDKYQLGVPQGGALSGVIANVVMHFTDMKLKRYWDKDDDFLYLRFCDDMIMMGVDRKKVEEAFDRYGKEIEKVNLYKHDGEPFTSKKMEDFWKGKTRPPYRWGAPAKDVMPWITFVGYDVNWEGDTRIRKSSLEKEIKKQHEKRMEIVHLFGEKGGKNPQRDANYIRSSVQKRLIGMSVGRVAQWNYQDFKNRFSWASAFTELTDNKWSRAQLRQLDRHRARTMERLERFLMKLDYKEVKEEKEKAEEQEHRKGVWFYGKPYSYYGQVQKKWKIKLKEQNNDNHGTIADNE